MFSVIYYQLFRTRLFRIRLYFELIVLFLHLKSIPLFRTCQKQSTYKRAQLETYCASLTCSVRLRISSCYYWAACASIHKMGFRSSAAKNGLPGEGRHDGLVPRNDVLTNGFIWFSLARTLARILFVPRLRSPWKTQKALRTWRRLLALFEAIRSREALYNFCIVRV